MPISRSQLQPSRIVNTPLTDPRALGASSSTTTPSTSNTSDVVQSSRRPRQRRNQTMNPSPPAAQLPIVFGRHGISLDWDPTKRQLVDTFIASRSQLTHSPNSLLVDWCVDGVPDAERRDSSTRKGIKRLLHLLSVHRDDWCPLSSFTTISFKVPKKVEGPAYKIENPTDGVTHRRTNFPADEIVELVHASHVTELNWSGDFFFLIMGFQNMPSSSLSSLSLTGCTFSVEDVLGVLGACINLRSVTLETIAAANDCESERGHENIVMPFPGSRVSLERLELLRITSTTGLQALFPRISAHSLYELHLSFEGFLLYDLEAIDGVEWEGLAAIIQCSITRNILFMLKEMCPKLQHEGIIY